MIGQYELLYILSGQPSEEEVQPLAQAVRDLLQKFGAHIVKDDFWGKRKLAYEIDHQRQGYYHLIQFDLDKTKLTELDRALRLNESVLRFQVVSRIVKTPEQLAAEQARRERIAAQRQTVKDKETVAAMIPEEAPAAPAEPAPVLSEKELEKKLEKILEEEKIDV